MNTEDKILAARTSLLWDHPFFGTLAVQLQTVDATDDERIDTMATDGKHLFYDRNFVDKLTKDELVFVLAHEVMHNALEHHLRRQSRKPGRWNVAADYAINGELVECKVGTMPSCGLIEDRFTGLSAEEIYRILDDEDNGGNGHEGSSDQGGCGGIIDGAPQHDEAAIAEARAEMQTQVRQAAAIAKAKEAGKLPAGVQRIVDQLLKPKVDWRSVLRRFVDESLPRDYAWSRPNRRMLSLGYITPSMVPDGLSHLVVAVDTSGSIDQDMLAAFAAEIRGAFEENMVDRLTVIYADVQVNRVETFEAGDELELNAKGGGGTRFSPTFEWIAEHAPSASCVVYLTDLQCNDFGDAPASPVIWAVYGDSRNYDRLSGNVPFGETVSLAA